MDAISLQFRHCQREEECSSPLTVVFVNSYILTGMIGETFSQTEDDWVLFSSSSLFSRVATTGTLNHDLRRT